MTLRTSGGRASPSVARRRPRRARRAVHVLMMLVLTASVLTFVMPASPADARTSPQASPTAAPTPARPVLLIGGTYVGVDHASWPDIVDGFFRDQLGYDPVWNDDPNLSDSLFLGELMRQDQQPANWSQRPPILWGYPWESSDPNQATFKKILTDGGGQTAGLAPLFVPGDHLDCQVADSVEQVMCLIRWYSAVANGDIDVIAHSQATAASRAAIRQLVELTGDSPVHTLVQLGGSCCGVSTHDPLFQVDTGDPGWDFFINTFFYEEGINDCRNDGWLPVCPDAFRRECTAAMAGCLPDYDWALAPIIPNGNNPDPNLHATNFFPWLNSEGGVGRLPQYGAGGTTYYNLYSQVYDAVPPLVEPQSAETIPLFSNHPHMAEGRNFCVQEQAEAMGAGANYPVAHGDEWDDPYMRQLIAAALLGWTDTDLFCPQP